MADIIHFYNFILKSTIKRKVFFYVNLDNTTFLFPVAICL